MPDSSSWSPTPRRACDASVETVLRELATMRTGRASVAMLDTIRVDYYGTPTPLNQVGNLAVPDPTLITLQPWDAVAAAGDREGDPHLRPRPQPPERRQAHPHPGPPAHRGAAQEARQDRPQARRGGPGRDPQRAPRRQRPPQEAAEGPRDQRGRREARPRRGPEAHRPAHRRDRRRPEEEGSRDHGGLTSLEGQPSALEEFLVRSLSGSCSAPRRSSPSPAASRAARRRDPHADPCRRHLHTPRRVPAGAQVDPEKGNARVAIQPADDPSALPPLPHWRALAPDRGDRRRAFASSSSRRLLPSPQDVDGDYFRARSPKAHPARNFVSAFVDAEARGVYEYQEVLRDPASPLAASPRASRVPR